MSDCAFTPAPSKPLRAKLRAFSPVLAVSGLVLATILAILPQPLARVAQSDFLELAASIQDDSFYYLLPAFQFQSKGVFTFDGYSPSYGFEPGYELLLSAYAIFFDDFQSFMRGAMTLGLLTHALTGLMIALLVLRAADAQTRPVRWIQHIAAAGAGSFYLTRGTVLFSSMTCKENILASFLLVAVLLLLVTRSTPTSDRRERFFAALCGFGVAALLLSRILPTTLATCVLITCAGLARWRRPWSFSTALIVPLVLWSAYALFAFGHVVPTSVRVKAMSVPPWHTTSGALPWTGLVSHGIDYLWATLAFAVGVHSQLGITQKDSALVVVSSRFELLWIGIGLFALVLVMFTGVGRSAKADRSLWTSLHGKGEVVPLLALLTMVNLPMYVAQGGLIAMRRPEELFYYTWYVYDLPVLVAASMGIAAMLGLRFLERQARLIATRTWTARALLAVGLWAVAVVVILGMFAVRIPRELGRIRSLQPYTEFDTERRDWNHTIIRAGLFLKSNVTLHRGERIACISCGALGVLLPGHVLNIDGLANDDAARHLLARPSTLDEYVLQVRPRYYIDIDIPLLRNPRIHVRTLQVFQFVYKGGYLVAELDYVQ